MIVSNEDGANAEKVEAESQEKEIPHPKQLAQKMCQNRCKRAKRQQGANADIVTVPALVRRPKLVRKTKNPRREKTQLLKVKWLKSNS